MKQLLVIALCVFCVSAYAQSNEELIQLQNILKATGASWEARSNNFTRQHPIEQERALGLLPAVGRPDLKVTPSNLASVRESLPAKYETEHTGIRNQGNCGSCYSFGASACLEGLHKKNGKTIDLSEQDFMMKAREISGSNGGCNGWYLDTSMRLLRDNGVILEKECPYTGQEKACQQGSTLYKSKAFSQISEYTAHDKMKEEIKKALKKYGPVYCGFAVYSDFGGFHRGVYHYTTGYLRGYHAVCIVGWDDTAEVGDGTKGAWKVKNSWGESWGENGYFRIGYSQMKNKVKFATCFGGCFYITK